ncbi:Divinyl chlorophyll a/b light-harvesting protein PcbF [Dirofilaria immitis]
MSFGNRSAMVSDDDEKVRSMTYYQLQYMDMQNQSVITFHHCMLISGKNNTFAILSCIFLSGATQRPSVNNLY